MMNQRQYPRFEFRQAVEYQMEEIPSSGSVASDISEGGLRLTVQTFIPLHTIVRLQIHVPGSLRVLPAKGKVVWVREDPQGDRFDIGIKFVVEQDTASDIHSFVTSRWPTVE